MLVWLAMTTGIRRGELCALRWDRIDFATGILDIRTSIGQLNTRMWEKDTKTHQRRRIVVDPQSLALLRSYLQRVTLRAAALGIELSPSAFVFSGSPDGSTWLRPASVTQRYSRMCQRQSGWAVASRKSHIPRISGFTCVICNLHFLAGLQPALASNTFG
jgi:integrase